MGTSGTDQNIGERSRARPTISKHGADTGGNDSPKAIDEVDDGLRGGCAGLASQGSDGVVFSRIRIDSAFFRSHSSASFLLSFVKADGG